MIKVDFSNRQDCEDIYHRMTKHLKKINVHDISVRKDGRKMLSVTFNREKKVFHHVLQPMLSRVFAEYIIETYELKWLHEELTEMYFYEDREEKREIVSIFYLIMEGKYSDLPNAKSIPSRRSLIETAVKSLLEDSFKRELSFSFDSFLKFRIKEYREFIATYIAMAIDEYKLEQDYQSFIENLRSFLVRKQPVIETVHVVYTNQPRFYDERLQLIHQHQLTKESSFFSHQSVIEPTLLQPLLTLAPKHVYLYADDDVTGLLYTLQNIFQERLTIRSLKEMPNISTPM